MSFSIIVRDAYQPDGGQVCSVANLVPAGPRSQDDVDSRLSVIGFQYIVWAGIWLVLAGPAGALVRVSKNWQALAEQMNIA